ncbi:MAG: DNA N-6-adenine-methyltransferase, partial [Candidatus Sifarchaeia archaeon]
MSVHYSSEKMDWGTPQDFFDRLDVEFNFSLDICASAENHKCNNYITELMDALSCYMPAVLAASDALTGKGAVVWM